LDRKIEKKPAWALKRLILLTIIRPKKCGNIVAEEEKGNLWTIILNTFPIRKEAIMTITTNMTLVDFLLLLLVAGICGVIGQVISGYSRGGFLAAIVLGFIGAFIGVWIAGTFALPVFYTLHIGTTNFPIIWSIIGATIFVALVGLLTSSRRR
jgi:uncharacterized membrane protein YeaQ/YmgE (transglycosylase-associated protein family)